MDRSHVLFSLRHFSTSSHSVAKMQLLVMSENITSMPFIVLQNIRLMRIISISMTTTTMMMMISLLRRRISIHVTCFYACEGQMKRDEIHFLAITFAFSDRYLSSSSSSLSSSSSSLSSLTTPVCPLVIHVHRSPSKCRYTVTYPSTQSCILASREMNMQHRIDMSKMSKVQLSDLVVVWSVSNSSLGVFQSSNCLFFVLPSSSSSARSLARSLPRSGRNEKKTRSTISLSL